VSCILQELVFLINVILQRFDVRALIGEVGSEVAESPVRAIQAVHNVMLDVFICFLHITLQHDDVGVSLLQSPLKFLHCTNGAFQRVVDPLDIGIRTLKPLL
jgi:hypothetical protein